MSVERRRLQRDALEERRVADVGRVVGPMRTARRSAPAAICQRSSPSNTSAYCSRNISDVTALSIVSWISRSVGQMSRRYTGCAVAVDAERLGREVDRHPAGERVGDDQRRRRQIVRAHLLLDAAFEVAIAAQHRRDDQVARP